MTPDVRRRYGRQIRLVDIGEAGQAKLCAAEVTLSGNGFARTIEERYVRAAGMTVAATTTEEERLRDSGLGLRHEAPRQVADGAWRALVAIRRALEIE